MSIFRALYAFSANLFRRRHMEQELDEELRAYTEMLAEEKLHTGSSLAEARRAARLEVGGVEQVKEQVRDVRIGAWVETLWQDLRYAARMLRRTPGFTIVTVLTLALGMGANTTMFSTMDALVLHPLLFPDSNRLIALGETQSRNGFESDSVAPADYLDWQQQSTVFESMAAYRRAEVDLSGGDEPEHLEMARVSGRFFSTLAVAPALGRAFAAEEEKPGNGQVAVLSYGLWQRQFAGDPRALQREIELNGLRYRVVGVMPADFDFPLSTAVWTPLTLTPELMQEREKQSLFVFGRLRPGENLRHAQAEAGTLAARLEQAHPTSNKGRTAIAALLRERVAGDFTPTFIWALMGSVVFVLSIACVNVANMQLARAAARRREIAVRAALGATRKRVLRQLLTENVLLALLGAAAGTGIAVLLLRLLRNAIPQALVRFIPGWQHMAIDARTLIFTFAVALLTGIVFGLAPSLAASRRDLKDALNKGGGSILGSRRHRARNLLVTAEIALALILLVGTGLMVKGFRNLVEGEKQGFTPEHLLSFGVTLAPNRYAGDQRVTGFYRSALESLRRLPEVVSATAVTSVPASGAWTTDKLRIEGHADPVPGQTPATNVNIVAPACFQTLGIPLLAGRDFNERDGRESLKVAVISQELARRYFPGNDPLGRRIRLGGPEEEWLTVVGVAGDVKRFMFDRGMRPMVYLPHLQQPPRSMHFILRTRGEPEAVVSAVRAQMLTVDPAQPVYEVKSLEIIIDEQSSGVRVAAAFMAFYGLLALVLSAVGVYGVVANASQQRTHEIGIRMAIGARGNDILRLVLAQTARLAATGLGIGLLCSIAMGRAMSGLMFGMIALDASTIAIFTLLLSTVALLAGYIPAGRAARVDPMITLRHD